MEYPPSPTKMRPEYYKMRVGIWSEIEQKILDFEMIVVENFISTSSNYLSSKGFGKKKNANFTTLVTPFTLELIKKFINF